MSDSDSDIDWSKTTWEGSRREKLRAWCGLSLRERLLAVEEMAALSEQFSRMRAQGRIQNPQGLETGGACRKTVSGVREPNDEYDAKAAINEVVMDGCTPTPLASYLKALGVLRLLSQKYPETRGFWRGDRFVLRTNLDRAGVERFFLDVYEPTPIIAPWNGGSGFYEKDNKTAIQSIQQSKDPRFGAFQTGIEVAEHALVGMDRSASPKGKDKDALLSRLRGLLPDSVLSWFDASISLTASSSRYPPLLGTGGNDGRLDFTNNFMQRLLDVLVEEQGPARVASQQWLAMTLFAKAAPGLAKNPIGQFSPGQAGGPNSSTGFEGNAATNPWDFVLMIEGALPFASAAVRRNADDPFGVMSFPFTVRAVNAGAGTLGEGDTANARGEMWMPLWQKAAKYQEIRALLAEGRVALGRKPARDALDFIRAAHSMGGYRGIQSFQRFGLLMRSGKAFLATPLSRVEISDEPQSSWLDELDQRRWLERFRNFSRGDNAASRYRILRKQLEDALFSLSGRGPSTAETQALLTLLGETQSALAIRALSNTKKQDLVPPIPRLSDRWVQAADDGTPAFRIAKALAGLRGEEGKPLPLRAQLFPVQRKYDQWMSPEAGERNRIYSGHPGRLIDTLHTLLQRRLWLANKLEMKDKPLTSSAGATAQDIADFLRDDRMDSRIASLLPGLCLCQIPPDIDQPTGDGALPAAFGLLKLALTPDRTLRSLGWLGEDERMPLEARLLAQLKVGNQDNRAVRTGWRRLHTSGLSPVFDSKCLPELGPIDTNRATAALLIPLRFFASGALARLVLKTADIEKKPQTI